MNFKFRNKRISGVLSVLPGTKINFDDEVENYNFSVQKSMKLKQVMGYGTRRKASNDVCTSDLCLYGLNFLFENGHLNKDDIDALILVTQSPDYFMPPTSNVIQGKLGLKEDMFCMDINQGCAGYVVGLIQSLMLLEQEEIKKVVLLNADVLSRKVSNRDRNMNPQIGDAASVTLIERSDNDSLIYGNLKMDGKGADALIIPAGGFRMPSTAKTGELVEDSYGNQRALDHMHMKGDEIFNFVQREIPPLIEDLLSRAGMTKEEVDYYLVHQPNKFMVDKLADKLGVSRDKMPSNIVGEFGNSSGVTIPVLISNNFRDRLAHELFKVCFCGFGVGLTWASAYMELGNLDFCQIVEHK